MILVQVSDMHVCAEGQPALGRIDTGARLAQCVEHILGLDPSADAVVATGDLVDQGLAEEYGRLRTLLAPITAPVYLIPGNHDDRAEMRRAFADHAYLPAADEAGGFLNFVVEKHPLRLVGLDSLVPGEPGGRLCETRLAWLDERLGEAPTAPTVILLHHPPFTSGIAHMDAMNCEGGAELGAMIERHPQVERILCGHLHRPIHLRWHGTLVSTAPTPGFQVALNLKPQSRADWIEEPAACQIHLWRPESGLISHMSYIGDYGPAQPFPWAEKP